MGTWQRVPPRHISNPQARRVLSKLKVELVINSKGFNKNQLSSIEKNNQTVPITNPNQLNSLT